MKRFVMGLVLGICMISMVASLGTAQVYPEGMISYWKFEEVVGNMVYDSVGNNHGYMYGPVSLVLTDVGYGLNFQNGYVQVLPHVSLNPEYITVEALIYVDHLYSCYNTAVAKNSSFYWHHYMLAFGCETGYWPEFWAQTASGVSIRVYEPPKIQLGTWIHWAGTYDGQFARLYLNGNLVAERVAPYGPMKVENTPLYIGRNVGGPGHNFFGQVDEVALYNRALTAEEIQQHYQNTQNGLGYEVLDIEALVEIGPKTISSVSKGNWVTAHIELPEGYDVNDIVITSVFMNGTLQALAVPWEIGDHDLDLIPDLAVKFNRSAVVTLLDVGAGKIVVITGELSDGTRFEGSDVVRVR